MVSKFSSPLWELDQMVQIRQNEMPVIDEHAWVMLDLCKDARFRCISREEPCRHARTFPELNVLSVQIFARINTWALSPLIPCWTVEREDTQTAHFDSKASRT